MGRRKTTPSYIVELPLVVLMRDEREALIRLDLQRRLYNACLGEALHRLEQMRADPAWAVARDLPRLVNDKPNPVRREAFRAVARTHAFTSAAISAFGTHCKNAARWNEGRARTDARVGAHEAQRVTERAFAAVEAYQFGTRGKPRFKGTSRPLHSLEGKSEGSGLRWARELGCLQWGGMLLRAKRPSDRQDPWLEQALLARTKYARILWRTVKGRRRWFVQLVQEGVSPRKYRTVEGAVVGLDLGPSNVAVFSSEAAALLRLAPEIEEPWDEARRLRRAMDRSRRATNAHAFNRNGTFKPGERITTRSKGYQRAQRCHAEQQRRLQATRARSHGRLCNQILALGNVVQAERLSYRSFQKNFGRSVQVRGPGLLISLLRRKAESAGGELRELNTRALKLSQYDHCTATYRKKSLSERWHTLGDGSGIVHRDVYSAFLAAQADGDTLHQHRAAEAWSAAQPLLGRAGWTRSQPVSESSLLDSAKLPSPEPVARQRALVERRSAVSPVGGGELHESAPRTPRP